MRFVPEMDTEARKMQALSKALELVEARKAELKELAKPGNPKAWEASNKLGEYIALGKRLEGDDEADSFAAAESVIRREIFAIADETGGNPQAEEADEIKALEELLPPPISA